jgi:hypothetical protein
MADLVTGDTTGTPEAKSEEVQFSEAFAEANKLEPEKADPPAAEEPIPAEKPDVIPAEPLGQQPGESDEKYEQRYKSLQGIHKHDLETWRDEKAALLAQLEEAKKPKAPEPTPSPEPEKPSTSFVDSLTDEQKEQLEQYENDFDLVSKMEGIKRNAELAKLRKEMQAWKDDVSSQIALQENRIAPAVKLVEENEQEAHFNLIRNGYTAEDGTAVQGHSDFEKFRDDGSITAWIESKPKYLQPALKQTYSKGTAVDVIDLFTDFKRDNGILTETETDQTPDNVVQMKALKKQALTPVTSRRGAVNTLIAAKDDFDGGWDEAQNK